MARNQRRLDQQLIDTDSALQQIRAANQRLTGDPSWRAEAVDRMVKRRLSGRGAYWGKVLGGALGGAAGRLASEYTGISQLTGLGERAGSYLGDKGSDMLQRYLGRGEYVSNDLINPEGPPIHVSSAQDELGNITITNREYLQDIVPTTSAFQTLVFQSINPGLATFAPWLSQIAPYYEEYEMVQLIYHFKTMVTDGNSTAGGTVIMATQYNPGNAPLPTKPIMENYQAAVSGKVNADILHGVECDPAKRGGNAVEYVRTGPIATYQDIKTYDLGVFQLATLGATANQSIGELWVEYTVRLGKSKVLLPGANPAVPSLTAGIVSTGGLCNNPFAANVGTVYNVGTIALATAAGQDNSGGCTYVVNQATLTLRQETFSFPAWVSTGRYLVNYSINVSGAAPVGLQPSIIGTNCVISNLYWAEDEAAPQTINFSFTVVINAPSQSIASFQMNQAFTTGTSAASAAKLTVVQIALTSTL